MMQAIEIESFTLPTMRMQFSEFTSPYEIDEDRPHELRLDVGQQGCAFVEAVGLSPEATWERTHS